jgi:hypothetical protein
MISWLERFQFMLLGAFTCVLFLLIIGEITNHKTNDQRQIQCLELDIKKEKCKSIFDD